MDFGNSLHLVLDLYTDQGRQQPLALIIGIFTLIGFSLCWCIKKTNDTIKNGGKDPDGPFELKFETQSQAGIELIGFLSVWNAFFCLSHN
jgi:hypothetical protein